MQCLLKYGIVVIDQYRSITCDIQPWNVEFNQGSQKRDRYNLSLSHISRCYKKTIDKLCKTPHAKMNSLHKE